MKEKDFISKFMENVCLVDSNISLEAKGFYYSMLMETYKGKNSLLEMVKESNEDIEYILKLVFELIINNYLTLSIKVPDDEKLVFLSVNNKDK